VLSYNSQGYLTEGAVSNFLFRMKGGWFTTPLTARVLPGVMRAIAIERCGVSVRNIHIDQIATIDSGIVLSSLKVALPISELHGRRLSMDQDMKDLISGIREKTQVSSIG
jgi:branched-chain amino acid aminotransferase